MPMPKPPSVRVPEVYRPQSGSHPLQAKTAASPLAPAPFRPPPAVAGAGRTATAPPARPLVAAPSIPTAPLRTAIQAKLSPTAANSSRVIQCDKPFFHWMPKDSPSVKTAITGQKMVPWNPNKAFWIFDLDKPYRPAMGGSDHVLIVYVMDDTAANNISTVKTLDFEHDTFQGETKHPWNNIVKSNEDGAYGLGKHRIKPTNHHVKSVRYATRKEVAKALNKSTLEVDAYKPKGAIGW